MSLQKVVYVAMPLSLQGREYNKIKLAKNKLISNNSEYRKHSFFNPFKKINQNLSGNEIMDECFKVIKKPETKAVLYILPLPAIIEESVTLGAISESDLALKINKPVFLIIFLNGKTTKISKINHLDDLMKKFDLIIPSWWLEVRKLNISRKFIETY